MPKRTTYFIMETKNGWICGIGDRPCSANPEEWWSFNNLDKCIHWVRVKLKEGRSNLADKGCDSDE